MSDPSRGARNDTPNPSGATQGRLRRQHLGLHALGVGEEGFAFAGQPAAIGAAHHQLRAERGLKRRDTAGGGGVVDAQALGGRQDLPGPGDSKKDPDVVPVHPAYPNTTVLWPLSMTRDSTCIFTARASTRASMSRPAATKSSAVMAWVTRSVSCSMIGPSSRSAVT